MRIFNKLAVTSTLCIASVISFADCQESVYSPMQKIALVEILDLKINIQQYLQILKTVKKICSAMVNCGGFSANVQQGRCAFDMLCQ